jgi:repressor LexA
MFGYRYFGYSSGVYRAVVHPATAVRPHSDRGAVVMPLTKRQRQILDYLASYEGEHGYAPSFEEIAEQFGYNSLATVHEHLSNLERKGYIKRAYNESRAIEILPSDALPKAIELPVLGAVAAGQPIEAFDATETIAVPDDFVRRAGSHYVLQVRGDSMIDDQITDGDYVVVHDRPSADNGEMVIAMLEDRGATVKRFYRERDGRIRLQPANQAMAPIYVREEHVRVQGIVVGVMRRY